MSSVLSSNAGLNLKLNDLSNSSISSLINLNDDDARSSQVITLNVTASGGKYYINNVLQDAVQLDAGNTYIFDYSSAAGHPLLFSTTANGTHGGGSSYTTGVTTPGANKIQISVTEDTPDLFYYCQSHSGMGGTAKTYSDVTEASEGLKSRHQHASNSIC